MTTEPQANSLEVQNEIEEPGISPEGFKAFEAAFERAANERGITDENCRFHDAGALKAFVFPIWRDLWNARRVDIEAGARAIFTAREEWDYNRYRSDRRIAEAYRKDAQAAAKIWNLQPKGTPDE